MPTSTTTAVQSADVQSLFEILERGGPIMYPIAICSIVAVAYSVERWIALRGGALGSRSFARGVADAVRSSGPAGGLERCKARGPLLGRILAFGLERADRPFDERDRAVGDLASTELRRLAHNLRPLLIVWLIAPLLGLLGTVWGMIVSFGEIATSAGLGKPELLASGIYQALTTTAAGLVVSIPAIVVYHLFKGRIESFGRRVEDAQRDVEDALWTSRASTEAA